MKLMWVFLEMFYSFLPGGPDASFVVVGVFCMLMKFKLNVKSFVFKTNIVWLSPYVDICARRNGL